MLLERSHLVVWVDKVLNLCLREFPHAQQTGPRGNLIPVRLADLGCCKWQLAAIVVQEVPAVTPTHAFAILYF